MECFDLPCKDSKFLSTGAARLKVLGGTWKPQRETVPLAWPPRTAMPDTTYQGIHNAKSFRPNRSGYVRTEHLLIGEARGSAKLRAHQACGILSSHAHDAPPGSHRLQPSHLQFSACGQSPSAVDIDGMRRNGKEAFELKKSCAFGYG